MRPLAIAVLLLVLGAAACGPPAPPSSPAAIAAGGFWCFGAKLTAGGETFFCSSARPPCEATRAEAEAHARAADAPELAAISPACRRTAAAVLVGPEAPEPGS